MKLCLRMFKNVREPAAIYHVCDRKEGHKGLCYCSMHNVRGVGNAAD